MDEHVRREREGRNRKVVWHQTPILQHSKTFMKDSIDVDGMGSRNITERDIYMFNIEGRIVNCSCFTYLSF